MPSKAPAQFAAISRTSAVRVTVSIFWAISIRIPNETDMIKTTVSIFDSAQMALLLKCNAQTTAKIK